MTELNNITVTNLDDGMVSLLIDQQPISEKYGTKFEASIVEDLKALENGHKLKLFEQFVFSHTDLNFEHAYYYVTGIEKLDDSYRLAKHFVYRIKIEGQPEIEHIISNQGKAMTTEDVRNFIQAHVQKALNDYTDLNYAY
ncbi:MULTISPECIES: hypothetical protein [Acinetobacter]|uniref:hypothetical protein n=1 Tax=Acinetobacter TaxID=469 RepID=UPI000C23EDF0|nr:MULTISPECIES: hypothetical protein [Acinetobacter]MCP0911284.1 hypothetical protein [Acinetobacter pseudolwoffii]MEE1124275.1 hypothetical protein [Acinetobacter pseudolwoffii]PJI34931.1 hypothetical protein CU318_10505 [Acinetobacter pseudolwoffii]